LKPGMKVCFAPSGLTDEVTIIEMHHAQLSEAIPGDNIGFGLKFRVNLTVSDIRRGMVVGDPDNDPPSEVMNFTAQITILSHPGQISPGYTPIIDCHTSHIACSFNRLLSKTNRTTGKEIEENPSCLRVGDTAMVVLVPIRAMSVEIFDQYPTLGRFTIRDMRTTVGFGIIKQITKKPLPISTTNTNTNTNTNTTMSVFSLFTDRVVSAICQVDETFRGDGAVQNRLARVDATFRGDGALQNRLAGFVGTGRYLGRQSSLQEDAIRDCHISDDGPSRGDATIGCRRQPSVEEITDESYLIISSDHELPDGGQVFVAARLPSFGN